MQAPTPLKVLDQPHRLPWAPLTGSRRLPQILKPGSTAFVTFSQHDATNAHAGSLGDLAIGDSGSATGLGECLLGDPACATIVEDTLLFFHGSRYLLHAWCVMPGHVDVLLTPRLDRPLSSLVASWKSFTTHQINQRLHREGPVFRADRVDLLIDRPEHGEAFISYIESNPVEAGLCDHPEDWRFSSARRHSSPSLSLNGRSC